MKGKPWLFEREVLQKQLPSEYVLKDLLQKWPSLKECWWRRLQGLQIYLHNFEIRWVITILYCDKTSKLLVFLIGCDDGNLYRERSIFRRETFT